jgi:hypothetical protein
MKSNDKPKKRGPDRDELDELDDDVPVHRPRVEHDEQREYEEWRKERGERGRKRRGHRERGHHGKDDDEF